MSLIAEFAAKAYFRFSEEVSNIVESPTLKRIIGNKEEEASDIPRMFAEAIAAAVASLEDDEESDLDEISPIFHLAELRIKQDLACFGYSEEFQEKISALIIDLQFDKIMAIFKKTTERINPTLLQNEINRYTFALPSTLLQVNIRNCPLPIDWRIHYGIAMDQSLIKKGSNAGKSAEAIRFEVFKNFEKMIDIINRKEEFYWQQEDSLVDATDNPLSPSCSPEEIQYATPLDLIFYKNELQEFEHHLDDKNSAELIEVWREGDVQIRLHWLSKHAYGSNPLLLHELALAVFESNPTLYGFKQAYEYILHGTLRIDLDAQCATDENLQKISAFIKAYYILQLCQLAKVLSSDLEMTKIYWWKLYSPYNLFNKAIIQRFLKTYNDDKHTPSPQWLFKHSEHYNSSVDYRYESLNSFAFPHWVWKRMRKRFLTALKASTIVN